MPPVVERHGLTLEPAEVNRLRAAGHVLLWVYCRVSTPKDQRPARQLDLCDAWTATENATRAAADPPLPPFTIIGTTWEKGVSGLKTWALGRDGFPLACDEAKAHGCTALLMEQRDRFSRRDPEEATWEKVEVKRAYGLNIWTADMSHQEQGTSFGGVVQYWKQAQGNDAMRTHGPRVKSGIATRKRAGKPVGGQTQAKVDDELVALVRRLAAENPAWGLRRIALGASRERGAFTITQGTAAARTRAVSHTTVQRVLGGRTWHQRRGTPPADDP